jgi:hypothetical protein
MQIEPDFHINAPISSKLCLASELLKNTGIFLSLLVLFFIFSCSNKQPDDVKEFRKDGSIEMTLSTDTLPNNAAVIMHIEYKVWKNEQMVHLRTIVDTIPTLSYKMFEMEDNEGNTIHKMAPPKYDFFVTVK